MNLAELRAALRAAFERMDRAHQAIQGANDDTTPEQLETLEREFTDAEAEHRKADDAVKRAEKVEEARKNAPVKPEETSSPELRITNEPHTYRRDTQSRSWLLDVAREKFGIDAQ